MKLSKPVINTIRFDTDFKIIGKNPGVYIQTLCEGYCLDGAAENGEEMFAVGIRIRLSCYIDKVVNEAAGYLSETESTVLLYTKPLEDLPMLNKFATDVFRNIKHNLQGVLPEIDLTSVEFPDPNKIGYFLSEGLIKKGLYNQK